MATYYIIMDADGRFMPSVKRGTSHQDLTAAGIPKLYKSRTGARNSLRTWLAGRLQTRSWGKDEFDLVLTPAPERKNSTARVWEVSITTTGFNWGVK